MGAYLDGDLEAFGTLYDRYARRLFGFALSLGCTNALAEDVAQTAWLKAIEALPRYKPRGRFQPWLFRIAHRVWLDQVGSAWERRRVSMDDSALDAAQAGAAPAAEDAVIARERHDALHAALDELPEPMRQVILLRLEGDMTYREIAAAMKSPLGTTLWRARQATLRLKDALEYLR